MIEEWGQRVREAEHRFCEAIDLKVNPETYDGSSCMHCIIGQLIIADHLADMYTNGLGEEVGFEIDGTRLEFYDEISLIAQHYNVDQEKVHDIFWGVADGEASENLETAKRDVVAAYFDCYKEEKNG